MDPDTEHFFRAVLTCLLASAALGIAVVAALAWLA